MAGSSAVKRKQDSAAIEQFILNVLPHKVRLDADRAWWLKYAFHFTDIRNAVGILSHGYLFSRQEMEKREINFVNGASPDIIDQTSSGVKLNARLFFRPLTPTLFTDEGIRPIGQHKSGAHLPVPVYLLFDLVDTLTRDSCHCSTQSAARSMFGKLADAAEIRSLPFAGIYHNTWLPDDPRLKSEIIGQRQCEIMIPTQLDLSGLLEIHCRSQAEKDTLLHLLPDATRQMWQSRIYSDATRRLFYKQWTYVDSVSLGKNHTVVNFSPDTKTPGPYKAEFTWKISGRPPIVKTQEEYNVRANRGVVSYRHKNELENYIFSVHLDGNLAYKNRFIDYEIPF